MKSSTVAGSLSIIISVVVNNIWELDVTWEREYFDVPPIKPESNRVVVGFAKEIWNKSGEDSTFMGSHQRVGSSVVGKVQ